MNKAILSLLIAMFLAGCAIGPDYKRPTHRYPQGLARRGEGGAGHGQHGLVAPI